LWLERGRTRKQSIQVLADTGFWNFQSWLQLMEAEDNFSNGSYQQAKKSYESAIATARSRGFVNVEALAAELAANFFFDTGDFNSSIDHFNLAHQKYLSWGGIGKACSLFAYMNEAFPNHF
jgi:tetratricopeptide (TPR) repeat protein